MSERFGLLDSLSHPILDERLGTSPIQDRLRLGSHRRIVTIARENVIGREVYPLGRWSVPQ